MSAWLAVPSSKGSQHYDLFLDRRPVAYDLNDLEEVIACVRARGGRLVEVEDHTGYRETHRVPR